MLPAVRQVRGRVVHRVHTLGLGAVLDWDLHVARAGQGARGRLHGAPVSRDLVILTRHGLQRQRARDRYEPIETVLHTLRM